MQALGSAPRAPFFADVLLSGVCDRNRTSAPLYSSSTPIAASEGSAAQFMWLLGLVRAAARKRLAASRVGRVGHSCPTQSAGEFASFHGPFHSSPSIKAVFTTEMPGVGCPPLSGQAGAGSSAEPYL